MYYVEESHPAIIDKEVWECVQLEFERRKEYMKEHGLTVYDNKPEINPFAGKVICGECGMAYGRKTWISSANGKRLIWHCNGRHKTKGVIGCDSCHVDESVLEKALIEAWNSVVENKDYFIEKWKEEDSGEDLLKAYKAKKFIELEMR